VNRRVMFVYSDTGRGHRSVADALAESVMSSEGNHTVQVTHVDIYQLAKVFLFRRAGRHYEILCRHARWLYDTLFRITDNPTAKNVITRAILFFYGPRLARVIARIDPDVIVVMHPLFASDVLCKLRDRSGAGWTVVSFVTDLGVAHAGWATVALDAVFFVSPSHVQKLRSQGCLPPESRTAIIKAPVRGAFAEDNRAMDGKAIETLGLKQPYVLYVPGLQSDRALARQVRHLTDDYRGMDIILVGSISSRLVNRLMNINPRLVHLCELSGFEMAAIFRKAEMVSGKAGPTVMAEAASVGAHFVPTAEVGCQEAGNALAGRALYGINAMPWWGEINERMRNTIAPVLITPSHHRVLSAEEVRMIIIGGSAERAVLQAQLCY
jgi:UDP-N-acetylglucosamine:LPS N-acetylglucosamine transferase